MNVTQLNENRQPVFTASHLARLRAEYSAIKRIDPDSPTFKRLLVFVSGLKVSILKQLANEDIPWLTSLALQELANRGEDYEITYLPHRGMPTPHLASHCQ